MIILFIDNCAWDVLYKHNVNLKEELGDKYTIMITGFGEVEIPDQQNPEVAFYARHALTEFGPNSVQKRFGYDSNCPNTGGYGEAPYASGVSLEYEKNQPSKVGGEYGQKLKKSGLKKNQTDVNYSGLSLEHPVVTNNISDFKHAIKEGGTVINIKNWEPSKETFREFIDFILS